MRPILASSCALATTAAEARYRIDRPIQGRPGARIIALDGGAGAIVRRVAGDTWSGARFFTLTDASSTNGSGPHENGTGPDITLNRVSGGQTQLQDELADADVAVMVATAHADAATASAASAIGRACARRGIMTAGLVMGDRWEIGETLTALRPYSQVLVVSTDDHDLDDMLAALRA